MRLSFKFLFPLVLFLFSYSAAKATHVSGAEITYQCIGADSFRVQLNIFRDCSGFEINQTTEYVQISSSCFNDSIMLTLTNPGGTEVSQLCSAEQDSSICNGGSLPGTQMYTFKGTVELSPCNDYVFGWSLCCRNTSLSFGGAEPIFYVQAEMNSTTQPCNNSPFFTAQPIPYVCANQQVSYNFGVTELDGDSVYYRFISAQDGLGSDIAYDAPYTPNQPIASGISLDSITGLLLFTPQQLGNVVIVVEVQEFDNQGNFIGAVIRDIQFIVQTCTNQTPTDTLGVIQSLTGTATQVDDYTILLCDGESFSFDVTISDPDLDVLTLTSNVDQVLPGVTFTTTSGDPAQATISWTATGGNNFNNTFVIYAHDDACPIPGIQSFVYNVQVQESTVASDNITLCGNQIANLVAQGGDNFTWTALPEGDPINIGVNFECDACGTTWADPDSTTSYQVVSDLATAGCVNTDTITVTVVPNFDFIMAQSETNVCLYEDISFTVTPDVVADYYYEWTPLEYFDASDTTGAVEGVISIANVTDVIFIVTSDLGCVKTDTFNIQVSEGPQPAISIFGDSTMCEGDSTILFTSICPNSSISNLYCLELYDDFGDGWNDAYLQLWLNDTLTQDFIFSQFPYGTGPYGQFCIEITEGTIIELRFFSGPSDPECSYYLVNMGDTTITTDDDTLFSDGIGGIAPTVGLAYTVCANSGSIVSPTLVYSWTQIGTISTPSNDSTYVSPSANQTYQVVVTDAIGGCTDSATYNVLVVPSFEHTITASDTAICLSTDATFTIATVPVATSDYTYSWASSPYFSDTASSSVTASSITQFGNVTFNYTVSSPVGCDKVGVASVFVSAGIQPNIQAYSDTMCVGDSLGLDPTMLGLSLTEDSCQIRIVLADTANNGWNGAVLSVSINGNTVNYTYTSGADTTILIMVGVTDTVCVSHENGSSPAEESYSIFNQTNVLLFSDGVSVDGLPPDIGQVWCMVQICGLNDATYTYDWSPSATLTSSSTRYTVASPSNTTTYQLIATDIIGYCADTADIEVVVSTVPLPEISPQSGLCIDENAVTLQVDIQGGVWSGAGIIDANAGAFDPAAASVGNNFINYSVIVAGCTGDTTVSITVYNLPPAPGVVTNNPYCELDSLNDITATGGGSLTWYEYNQSTQVGLGNNPNLGAAEQSDTLFVNETLNGCAGPFAAVPINVFPIPVVSFTTTPEQGFIPFEVVVANTSPNDELNYVWNFGNGETSSEQHPESIIYTETGDFMIVLTGADVNGCQSRDTVMIDSDDKIYVPVVFSPNGDDVNDKFRVSGFQTENFECIIYNRWGVKVFEFTDPNNNSWDGGNQSSGTYFVVISYTDWDGNPAQNPSTLTLLKERKQ